MTGTERATGEEEQEVEGTDEPIEEISQLHKMSAPQTFEAQVTETIRRRSGGRFFGRKTLGDRVPFLLLAVIALVVGLIVFLLVRSSDTGSLRYKAPPEKPNVHPEAPEQMPSPYRQ